MTPSHLLEQVADDFAAVVPTVDAEAEHDRWQAGIGPFEEAKETHEEIEEPESRIEELTEFKSGASFHTRAGGEP